MEVVHEGNISNSNLVYVYLYVTIIIIICTESSVKDVIL
jgi:hypothetical protein